MKVSRPLEQSKVVVFEMGRRRRGDPTHIKLPWINVFPIISIFYQSGADGVVADVFAFLESGFPGADSVVEESTFPLDVMVK